MFIEIISFIIKLISILLLSPVPHYLSNLFSISMYDTSLKKINSFGNCNTLRQYLYIMTVYYNKINYL